MSSPAAANVEAALIEALIADVSTGGLMTLMSDGVFMDVARSGSTKFVIVSLVIHHDEYAFSGTAFEEALYLVKAVDLNTSPVRAKAAAARIYAVLQDAQLTIDGYGTMLVQREERVQFVEIDDADKDIRWQHAGGRFRVFVSPSSQ